MEGRHKWSKNQSNRRNSKVGNILVQKSYHSYRTLLKLPELTSSFHIYCTGEVGSGAKTKVIMMVSVEKQLQSTAWQWTARELIATIKLQVLRLVGDGYRLSPPPGCPRAVYKLMVQCWWVVYIHYIDRMDTLSQLETGDSCIFILYTSSFCWYSMY